MHTMDGIQGYLCILVIWVKKEKTEKNVFVLQDVVFFNALYYQQVFIMIVGKKVTGKKVTDKK